MKAIILAAGRGSRMKNLTDERPKCFIELNGKKLIESQLEAIRAAGIHEIAVVTGYKSEMLTHFGLTEFHNPRWAETNMVSSLACADTWLRESPCIVSYSDIFYDSEAVILLMKSTSPLAVTYDPSWLSLWEKRFGDPLLDAETFCMDDKGFLTEIGQKPKLVDEIEGQYMGLLRFSPEGWREIKSIRNEIILEESDKMHMTGTLQRVIDANNLSISAIPYYGEWGEIDSAQDLSVYQK